LLEEPSLKLKVLVTDSFIDNFGTFIGIWLIWLTVLTSLIIIIGIQYGLALRQLFQMVISTTLISRNLTHQQQKKKIQLAHFQKRTTIIRTFNSIRQRLPMSNTLRRPKVRWQVLIYSNNRPELNRKTLRKRKTLLALRLRTQQIDTPKADTPKAKQVCRSTLCRSTLRDLYLNSSATPTGRPCRTLLSLHLPILMALPLRHIPMSLSLKRLSPLKRIQHQRLCRNKSKNKIN